MNKEDLNYTPEELKFFAFQQKIEKVITAALDAFVLENTGLRDAGYHDTELPVLFKEGVLRVGL